MPPSSMAPTLPTEILMDEILPRLPAKSLLRFKTVCKFFNSLISSPSFIHHHLHQSLSSNTNLLLILAGNHGPRICSSALDSPETDSTTALQLHPRHDVVVSIIGSCNGVLCFGILAHAYKSLMVLNPTTGISREIPYPNPMDFPVECYGFGYDNTTHDYKIVGVVEYSVYGYDHGEQRYRGVLVYSFNDNEWRDVEDDDDDDEDDMMVEFNTSALTNNHLVHYLFWSPLRNQHRIGCFNLCNEQWGDDVTLPNYSADNRVLNVLHLGVLDGCLCLLTTFHERPMFDVWVMKEYGVKESWVNLVSLPDEGYTRSLKMTPLAYAKESKDEILLKGRESKLFWYNIKDKTSRKAGLDGVSDYYRACICEGSLATIPGGEQINVTKLPNLV